jgi:hypothetical protein
VESGRGESERRERSETGRGCPRGVCAERVTRCAQWSLRRVHVKQWNLRRACRLAKLEVQVTVAASSCHDGHCDRDSHRDGMVTAGESRPRAGGAAGRRRGGHRHRDGDPGPGRPGPAMPRARVTDRLVAQAELLAGPGGLPAAGATRSQCPDSEPDSEAHRLRRPPLRAGPPDHRTA